MTTSPPPQPDIRSLLENGFDEETANLLYDQGREVVTIEPEWIEVNVNGVRIENEKAFGGPWLALGSAHK